jgi:hypothetical protein
LIFFFQPLPSNGKNFPIFSFLHVLVFKDEQKQMENSEKRKMKFSPLQDGKTTEKSFFTMTFFWVFLGKFIFESIFFFEIFFIFFVVGKL